MNTSQPEPIDIEELLTAAGIDFEVVARCPDGRCELCSSSGLSAAA